jgi:hypothetical protein
MAYDLKQQAYGAIKHRWETALEAEMSKGEWSEIPKPMVALPAPGETKSSREEASKMLAELGASEMLQPKTDHRAWIGKVLQRAQRGDSSLPGIAVRFAREAIEGPAKP